MLKPQKIAIKASNIANLGSDLDHKIKQNAAKTEAAWKSAGTTPGLQIWRIESFNVKTWPKDKYGSFFSGDSYIVLNTYKRAGDTLGWDVHFWLGAETSQDEAGTAAYKTVELDELLGGLPVQHREVQGHESELFRSYFPRGLLLLNGGADSGFKNVKPEEYKPRLLQVRGKKNPVAFQVPLSGSSLNSGDVFILDLGLKVFQWAGVKCQIMERNKAAELVRAIDDQRGSKVQVVVLSQNDGDAEAKEFFQLLGGKPENIPDEPETEASVENKLFRLSDDSGFEEVASKKGKLARSLLKSEDVFVLQTAGELFVWVGKGSSSTERKKSLSVADDYIKANHLPLTLSVSRVLEGGENEVFNTHFK